MHLEKDNHLCIDSPDTTINKCMMSQSHLCNEEKTNFTKNELDTQIIPTIKNGTKKMISKCSNGCTSTTAVSPYKRERFTFKSTHLEILERYFKEDPYPDANKRDVIAQTCNEIVSQQIGRELVPKEKVTIHVVANWFANRRKESRRKKGFNNPYVTISLGNEKFKTSVYESTNSPEWNESCEFPIPEKRSALTLNLYHHTNGIADDFIGQVIIPLSDFSDDLTKTYSKWYPLKSKSGKQEIEGIRGELQVSTAFEYRNITSNHDKGDSSALQKSNDTGSSQSRKSILSISSLGLSSGGGGGKNLMNKKMLTNSVNKLVNKASTISFKGIHSKKSGEEDINITPTFSRESKKISEEPKETFFDGSELSLNSIVSNTTENSIATPELKSKNYLTGHNYGVGGQVSQSAWELSGKDGSSLKKKKKISLVVGHMAKNIGSKIKDSLDTTGSILDLKHSPSVPGPLKNSISQFSLNTSSHDHTEENHKGDRHKFKKSLSASKKGIINKIKKVSFHNDQSKQNSMMEIESPPSIIIEEDDLNNFDFQKDTSFETTELESTKRKASPKSSHNLAMNLEDDKLSMAFENQSTNDIFKKHFNSISNDFESSNLFNTNLSKTEEHGSFVGEQNVNNSKTWNTVNQPNLSGPNFDNININNNIKNGNNNYTISSNSKNIANNPNIAVTPPFRVTASVLPTQKTLSSLHTKPIHEQSTGKYDRTVNRQPNESFVTPTPPARKSAITKMDKNLSIADKINSQSLRTLFSKMSNLNKQELSSTSFGAKQQEQREELFALASSLSKDELISYIMDQEATRLEHESKIEHLNAYIEELLCKILLNSPGLLEKRRGVIS